MIQYNITTDVNFLILTVRSSSITVMAIYSLLLEVFGYLYLLPLFVGWGIMGYESEPLNSQNELRNLSYSIKFF